ncbi:MAG: glycosyltransferase family 2 protein [Terriglobia bacterium]
MTLAVSVVIPVYNAASNLQQCLASLSVSTVPPLECIVVDDASTDDSLEIAAQHGAKVLSTGGRLGPARARNIGAEAASGEIVFFLDADVCVSPDTISKIVNEFTQDPELDTVMGSYDDSPAAQNFMSQFRNLMHSYVHQHSNPKAVTFWSGCGAIRRQVFLDSGGFDANRYQAPAIEDVELGYRLVQANRKLALNADIRVKHLKRWNLHSMIKTDFFHRAIPWSELTLRSGRMPNHLNLRISQRISVMLALMLVFLAVYDTVRWHAYFLTPLFAIFFILLSSHWMKASPHLSPVIITLMFIVMGLIAGLSYRLHMYAIIPVVVGAWIALFARYRYAYSLEKRRRWIGALVGGYCFLIIAGVTYHLLWHRLRFVFLALLLTLVVLNSQFYVFLAGARGTLFAVAAIPFHLLYFVYSGVGFMVALIRHSLRKLLPTTTGVTGFTPSAKEAKVKATTP